MIVVLLAAVTIALHQLGVRCPSVLSVYFWPVVLAGYYYGKWRAVATALLAVAVVCWFAILVPGAFAPGSADFGYRWIDIAIWSMLLLLTATVIGHLYEVKQQAYGELRRAYNGVLQLLSKFIDTADRYTEAHSVRVSRYATEIARRLGLAEADVEDIRVAGLLHDVGKLEVSAELLHKVGTLTRDEWEEIRRHPANGAWLIGRVGGMLRNAIPLILYHHERFDGRGYYQLRGEEIPLGARVIAGADAFDAMTTDRSYRRAMTAKQALGVIGGEADGHFDPEVVRVFLQAMRDPLSRLGEVHDHSSRFEGLSWPDLDIEGLVTAAAGAPRPRLL